MSLNALVTGATSGIGRAIATQAIEQGYTAIGVGRDFSKNDLNFAQAITLDQSDLGAVDA
ncbi:SDR family NAD(P)-dependent oxidoreductase, partial [bacterium]|nr:SDR family NAD(P)-dependent oxidoreductase [bacterium]